ncbi:MAG: cyclic nucleotide-binding domain-containing protein [Chthoniobacteraceae bacterium]
MNTTFSPIQDVTPVLSILSKISIFGGVTDTQQQEIFRRLEVAHFAKGDCVFRAGDDPTHIYIVESGLIDLQITSDHMVLDKKELGVGECFGHVALLSMQKHSLTAIALEDTRIMVLSRRSLIQLKNEDIHLFALLILNIARELARRLRFTDDLLLHSMRPHEEYAAH